jgi:hypothetical protein
VDRRTKASLSVQAQRGQGAATAVPARARALWSARVKIRFSLPALTVIFLQKFELKWTK